MGMEDKQLHDTLSGMFKPKQAEPTPFDGQDLIDPRAMRDYLQKPCSKCGLPTIQQFTQVSHRGNFRHGGHKIVVRPIGKVCECAK